MSELMINNVNEAIDMMIECVLSYQLLFGNIFPHNYEYADHFSDTQIKIIHSHNLDNELYRSVFCEDEFNYNDLIDKLNIIKSNDKTKVTPKFIKQMEIQMIKLLVINMNDINKELYTKFKTAYMNFTTSFYNLEKGQKYSDLLHFTVSCPYFAHLTLKPAHIEKVDYEYYSEIREKFIFNIKNIEHLIIHKPFNEIKHYKLPNNIIDFINLKTLSISCDTFKKFPKELSKLKKIKNIYVGRCSNLSKLGFSLEQFKNISIFFDENIYGHKYDIEASSYIIKKNNSLQFYHGPTDRSNSSRTFNGRTPVIYLQFINSVYANLPTDLKSLTICGIDTFNSKNISESHNSYFFDKLEYKIDLTNLPMSLETLKISCSKKIKDNIDKYVNIKLPYGCKLTFSRKKLYNIVISHEIPEHYKLFTP